MIQGRDGPTSGTLRLGEPGARVAVSLRSGETVAVHVVRQSGAGRWTVVVRGRTLTASSDVPLIPGSVVSARVGREGSLVILRAASGAGGRAGAAQGAGDPAEQAVARALIASGLGVTASRLEQLRPLAVGSGMARARRLRLAAEILKKLPDLGGQDAASLTRLLGPDDEGSQESSQGSTQGSGGGEQSGERRRSRPRRPAVTPASVRAGLWGEDGEAPEDGRTADLLRLFNHMTSRREEWVVLPCRFSSDGVEIEGSLRILYDTAGAGVRAAVLGVGAGGGALWWFRLIHGPSGLECRVFCDGARERDLCGAELATLGAQLGNMGVRVADTVEDGAEFDGFEPMISHEPHPVDILG